MRPRDMAKLGQLFLQGGRWSERQILSEVWIRTATRAHVARTTNRDHYGYSWWVKGEDFPGMFEAVGRGGQRINVWPAKNIVLVFTGGEFEPGDLAKFILKALKSDGPLPANTEAGRELREQIANAARPPSSRPVSPAPAIASHISGRVFKLSANTLGLGTIALRFNASTEAQAELTAEKFHLLFPLGLDGVERFSPNAILNLPQAAKGGWQNGDTFVLDLNLVGGINHYRFRLKFTEDAKSLKASLNERTGLNDERFEGVASF